MPLYEYKCDNCGNVFETVQKFNDPYLTVHEACGGGPVHRLLSVPSLQFKGSGFYITDYARGSAPGGNGPSKKAETSTASESKSESSPATAAPAAATSAGDSKTASKPATNTSSSTSDKK